MSIVKNTFEEIINTDHKVITEESSKTILKKYGVKVPGFALAKSADEAAKQAKKLGFPLVMKVVSPQIYTRLMLVELRLASIMLLMLKKHSMTCMEDYLKRKVLT